MDVFVAEVQHLDGVHRGQVPKKGCEIGGARPGSEIGVPAMNEMILGVIVTPKGYGGFYAFQDV
jgi:hypothetical protein